MEIERLIKSLGSIYTSIYDIDLTTGRYQELSSFDLVHERIGKEGDTYNYYLKENVDGSYSYIGSNVYSATVGTNVTAQDRAGNFSNSKYKTSVCHT